MDEGKQQPLVSVIIPTYKRPNFLKRAIRSVLRQTYQHLEVIVVNGDPTTKIEDVLPEDDRIQCINQPEKQGVAAARNVGIKRSRGEFIAILDDDDLWMPQKIEKQVKRFKELGTEFGMVYGGMATVKDGKFISRRIPREEGDLFETLLRKNIVPCPTPLIRKDYLMEVGLFDTSFKGYEDLDMWLRIAKNYKVAAVSEVIAIRSMGHTGRMSEDQELLLQATESFLGRYREDLAKHPLSLFVRFFQLAFIKWCFPLYLRLTPLLLRLKPWKIPER